MRILFALPGLHLYNRGAETAFISVAKELVALGERVTLIGSGTPRQNTGYRFLHAGCIGREKFEGFPALPFLRNEYAYEDLTFLPDLLLHYRPDEYDLTITCSFPFTNLALRRPMAGRKRPPHVFVTQNGDWPAFARNSENRFFGCEGLICINPDYYDRNHARWRSRLISNGVDCSIFKMGPPRPEEFNLPENRLIILMVSALDATKRVAAGVAAVSQIPDAHLVVAGDGVLRREIDELAATMLPGRYTRLSTTFDRMPVLYQSANVFLHLSRIESFGNVYLEAMACGLPVIAHDSARTRWILGEDEYLISDDDPVKVAQQIARARVEPAGKREARKLRAAGFSWASIGKRYQDFLKEVVGECQDCRS
jgi:glycosyltransferase involved in cell wall biosynthesis